MKLLGDSSCMSHESPIMLYQWHGCECLGQGITLIVRSVSLLLKHWQLLSIDSGTVSSAGPAARLQQMLRGQRLPPIPHLLSVMVQPKQV